MFVLSYIHIYKNVYVHRHAPVCMYVLTSVCTINNAALSRLHSNLRVNNATFSFNHINNSLIIMANKLTSHANNDCHNIDYNYRKVSSLKFS